LEQGGQISVLSQLWGKRFTHLGAALATSGFKSAGVEIIPEWRDRVPANAR
jgi:hypothetical protein